ncbi:homeodomain transcription factor [Lithospermum erythrorhizon]|uniref:Homeodomain transcription factor n=1 Tax=Lithospermum erythrorhizon TaxID=34254 RepID=A0AAV3RRX0_LITER
MAAYYNINTDLQSGGGGSGGDGLQTLVLMNPPPGYGYSDTQQQPSGNSNNNLVFLNSNNPGNSLSFSHAPQQLVGIPLAPPSSAVASLQDHLAQNMHTQQDISALHGLFPREVQYSMKPNETKSSLIPISGVGVRYSMFNNTTTIDFTAAREVPRSHQGLSLSLSPQQHEKGGGGGGGSCLSPSVGVSNGMQNVLLSSKYLKAAQEVLDEVVNVGKGVKNESGKRYNFQIRNIGESSSMVRAEDSNGNGDENNRSSCAELTTAERQEIQMKKAKLVNMLDEVERRYKQYHQQMLFVISWFEQSAGIGSAKAYTALALQTISKQFRCLKDAILGQIKTAIKSLGEEESFGAKIEGSRLKFVDNQLRQQRALQQLGMIQHNAWRPQRGLPERSVSVLRAWLFQHFLHPYPKDSDKIMLAKQTGLTRSQVSNWFINARVRLWKPMVEDMYNEEMKEQEKNASEAKTTKSENEDLTSKTTPSQEVSPRLENQNFTPISMSTTSTSPSGIQNQSGFRLISPSEMENISQASPKKPRSNDMLCSPTGVSSIDMLSNSNIANNEQMEMKFDNEKQSRDGFSSMAGATNFIGGFGSFSMAELGRFGTEQFPGTYSGNGVSLTLGLPHCENLSMSGNHQSFLQNQSMQQLEANDFSNINTPTSTHSTNVYENLNIQNRKRFAAQLLPDYVS